MRSTKNQFLFQKCLFLKGWFHLKNIKFLLTIFKNIRAVVSINRTQLFRKFFPKNKRVRSGRIFKNYKFFFFKKHNNCGRIKNLHFFSHIWLKFYAMNARRMQTFCDTYNKSTFFKEKFEFWDTFSKKIEKISSATEFFSIFLSDRLTDGFFVCMG